MTDDDFVEIDLPLRFALKNWPYSPANGLGRPHMIGDRNESNAPGGGATTRAGRSIAASCSAVRNRRPSLVSVMSLNPASCPIRKGSGAYTLKCRINEASTMSQCSVL